MQELDDIALLREYVERDSEQAFATLVSRHINKVYSVALRHTRNPHQAEEITQAVFVILAQKSRCLSERVVLSGWLYHTARLTAVTFIRSEIRRARREHEVLMQTSPDENEADAWPQIAPLLDDALAWLGEKDRHAVVLRFFDGKSMKEVGAALGGSEDAAKMRVNRAVEKLRIFFAKRGVVLPAVALAAAISANAAQAAPTALAATVTVAAIKGTTVTSSTLTLIKTTLKLMAWTKLKTATVTAVILLTGGATTIVVRELRHPNSKTTTNPIQLTGWRAEIRSPDLTPEQRQQIAKIGCLDNLKQAAAALRQWAAAHNQTFPNDLNSLQEYLASPMYLTCPSDEGRTETMEWAKFRPGSTSYVMVSPGAKNPPPNLILVKCPVHGHVALAEGRVFQGDYIKEQGMQITKQNTLE